MAATSSPLLAAACSLILLSLLAPHTAAEQVVLANSALYARQALYNRNRGYRFEMRGDCNLVLSEHDTFFWQTNTVGSGWTCQAKVNPSGFLVVSDQGKNSDVWWSTKSLSYPCSYALVLQNDLNVVIYSQPLWTAGTSVGAVKHQPGDQILLAGQVLQGGQFLEDENMHFQLVMQEDCDLVLYDDGNVIWSSGTSGKGNGCRATLSTAGHLMIQNLYGATVWTSSVSNPDWRKHALLMLPDGKVAVYTGAVWSTGTNIPPAAAEQASLAGVAAAGGQNKA